MFYDAATHTSVVLYGSDHQLLRVRAMLLISAGYNPCKAENLAVMFQLL